MITDMIDLEPLLEQYDRETLLVGPLLGLSLSSSYRYFNIAGKGTKIYHALGLGFVDNEADADRQRAEVVQKLKARFAEVVTFVSHPEMARAVHARWPSEETTRVLSQAEILAKAELAGPASHETITNGSDENASDDRSEQLVDVLARELLEHARRNENVPIDSPAPVPTRNLSVTEQSRPLGHLGRDQRDALTAKPASTVAAHESTDGRHYETGLTDFNDQLARELLDRTSHDHAKLADPLDGPTPANAIAGPLASGELASKADLIKTASYETASGTGPSEIDDKGTGQGPREPLKDSRRLIEKPIKLPPAAALSPPANRPSEAALGQQHRDFGLAQDDIASAILKLKSPAQSDDVPRSLLDGQTVSPAEVQPSHPDNIPVPPVGRARSLTSTILRFGALGAAIVFVGVLMVPSMPQRMEQRVPAATVAAPAVSNKVSDETQSTAAVPVSPVKQLAEQQAMDKPAPAAIVPAPSVLNKGSNDTQSAAVVAPSSNHRAEPKSVNKPVVPATVVASSNIGKDGTQSAAAVPVLPLSQLADAGAPAQQTEILPGTVASSPAAQPPKAKRTGDTIAAESDQHAASAQEPDTTDRLEAGEVAKLVNRGMQSLKNGDLESARLALQRAAEAISGAVATSPTSNAPGNTASPSAASQASVAPAPDQPVAAIQPSPLTEPPAATAPASKPSQRSQVASLEAGAPATGPATPAQENTAAPAPDQPEAANRPSPVTEPPTAIAPASKPPQPSQVTSLEAGAPVTGPTTPAQEGSAPPARDQLAAANQPSSPTEPQATTAPASKPSQPSHVANLESGAPLTGQTTPTQDDSATARHLDPDVVATLLRRGLDFLKNGDFASARLSLRRAAEAGNADAALALGSTYDPLVLNELGAVGIAPDVASARRWYEKAKDLGSIAAAQRLAKLPPGGE